MKLVKTIRSPACANGACPAFHLTDTGAVVVQGAKITVNPRDSLDIPQHEDVVAIPKEVFDALVAEYTRRRR